MLGLRILWITIITIILINSIAYANGLPTFFYLVSPYLLILPLSFICSILIKYKVVKEFFTGTTPERNAYIVFTLIESVIMLFLYEFFIRISVHDLFTPYNRSAAVFLSCLTFPLLAWPVNFLLVINTSRPRYMKAFLLGVIFPSIFWALGFLVFVGDFPPDYSIKLELYREIDKRLRETKSSIDFVQRGWKNISLGRHKLAIGDFNRAIELNPLNSYAYYSRGMLYKNQKQVDLAIADFNRALELDPFDPNAQSAMYARGLSYFQKNEYDQAIADSDRVIKISGDDLNKFAMGVWSIVLKKGGEIYLLQGRYEQGLSDLELYLKYHVKDGEAFYLKSQVFYSKKDYDQAWLDIHESKKLGYSVSPDFLKKLRQASGRDK